MKSKIVWKKVKEGIYQFSEKNSSFFIRNSYIKNRLGKNIWCIEVYKNDAKIPTWSITKDKNAIEITTYKQAKIVAEDLIIKWVR